MHVIRPFSSAFSINFSKYSRFCSIDGQGPEMSNKIVKTFLQLMNSLSEIASVLCLLKRAIYPVWFLLSVIGAVFSYRISRFIFSNYTKCQTFGNIPACKLTTIMVMNVYASIKVLSLWFFLNCLYRDWRDSSEKRVSRGFSQGLTSSMYIGGPSSNSIC